MTFEDSPQSIAEARALADREAMKVTAERVEKMSAGVADTAAQALDKIKTAADAFEKARKDEADLREAFAAKLTAAAATPPAAAKPSPKGWAEFVEQAMDTPEFRKLIDTGSFSRRNVEDEPAIKLLPGMGYADQSVRVKFDDATGQTLAALGGATPNSYSYSPIFEGFMARPFSAECPSMEMPAATFVYPRETEASRLSAIRTHVTTQGETGSAVLVVQSTAGMYVGQVLKIFSTNTLTRTIATVDSAVQVTMSENHGETVPDNSVVVSQEYTSVAEGAQAPYTLISSTAITATMYADVVLAQMTRQAMTYQNLLSIFQNRLPRYAAASLSKKLLYGTGASVGTVPGLMNSTGCQDFDWGDGEAGDTKADAVLRAWSKIRTGGMAKAWCNIDDLISMATFKTAAATTLEYAMSSLAPVSLSLSEGGMRLGWIPLGVDASFAAGNFLVIDHAAAHTVLRDSRLTGFDVGYVSDDFAKGKIHARYSQQIGQAIFAFGAYVSGDWDSAPS